MGKEMIDVRLAYRTYGMYAIIQPWDLPIFHPNASVSSPKLVREVVEALARLHHDMKNCFECARNTRDPFKPCRRCFDINDHEKITLNDERQQEEFINPYVVLTVDESVFEKCRCEDFGSGCVDCPHNVKDCCDGDEEVVRLELRDVLGEWITWHTLTEKDGVMWGEAGDYTPFYPIEDECKHCINPTKGREIITKAGWPMEECDPAYNCNPMFAKVPSLAKRGGIRIRRAD